MTSWLIPGTLMVHISLSPIFSTECAHSIMSPSISGAIVTVIFDIKGTSHVSNSTKKFPPAISADLNIGAVSVEKILCPIKVPRVSCIVHTRNC